MSNSYAQYFGNNVNARELTGDELTRVLESLREEGEDPLGDDEVVMGVCLCDSTTVSGPTIMETNDSRLLGLASLAGYHVPAILDDADLAAFEGMLDEEGHSLVGYFAIPSVDFSAIFMAAVSSMISGEAGQNSMRLGL